MWFIIRVKLEARITKLKFTGGSFTRIGSSEMHELLKMF